MNPPNQPVSPGPPTSMQVSDPTMGSSMPTQMPTDIPMIPPPMPSPMPPSTLPPMPPMPSPMPGPMMMMQMNSLGSQVDIKCKDFNMLNDTQKATTVLSWISAIIVIIAIIILGISLKKKIPDFLGVFSEKSKWHIALYFFFLVVTILTFASLTPNPCENKLDSLDDKVKSTISLNIIAFIMIVFVLFVRYFGLPYMQSKAPMFYEGIKGFAGISQTRFKHIHFLFYIIILASNLTTVGLVC